MRRRSVGRLWRDVRANARDIRAWGAGRLWREFLARFEDCSAWLARWFLLWRWVVDFYRLTLDVRRSA